MKKTKLILNLLNSVEKKKLYLLVILMIFGGLLETLGIGLVIPAISILINGSDQIINYPVFDNSFFTIRTFSEENISIIVFTLLFTVFLVKSLFLVLLYNYQFRFSSNILQRITNEIFKKISSQPYSLFTQKNSSKYLNTLSNESRLFVDLCIEPLVSISTELIIFIFIIFFLIYIEPTGSIFVIFTLVTAMGLFYFLTRKKTRFWGTQRQEFDEKLVKNMQETFHGIKEIKIFNTFNFIFSIFNKNLNQSVEARRKINFLLQLPRVWLEIIAILVMTIIVLMSVIMERDSAEVVPILAVFAAAAFRIIPSANRILIASQNLRYGFASAEKLLENITEIRESYQKQSSDFKTKIIKKFDTFEMKNVSFNYETPEKKIFENLNFKIKKGEIIGIVGSTGIGKSTFIDLFCGLIKQNEGEIIINNEKINNETIDWSCLIGYVPQNYYLLDESIKNNIAFGQPVNLIDDKKINNSINFSQLNKLIKSLPDGISTNIGERGLKLSGGQKQRLAIARALYFDPEIIIFDEGTSNLDIRTEEELINTIKNLIRTKTIILITHRLSTLKDCDKIYEVKDFNLKELDKKDINFN